jgi:hypothetical protein
MYWRFYVYVTKTANFGGFFVFAYFLHIQNEYGEEFFQLALVTVKGTYLSSGIQERRFNDKEEKFIVIDVYQSESPLSNKAVQIRADDLTLINQLHKMKMGDPIELVCTVNSYQNRTYFKLDKLVVKTA